MAVFETCKINSEIYANLRSVGCCRCCCLRYLGVRTTEAYQNVKEWVNERGLEKGETETDESEPKVMKSNPCVACIGLLQGLTSSNTVDKVASKVLSESYDCDTFSCAVSLPIAFQLRAHSLWIYLEDHFPIYVTDSDLQQESHVTAIKDIWKWTLGPKIGKAIKKDLDSGAQCDFSVGIAISYDDDEEECSYLLKMHEDIFKERRVQKRKYHGGLFTRKAVDSILASTENEHFKKFFPSPPPIPSTFISYDEVSCSHNSIFIAGCYNKYSRFLSQTPWVIEGERRMESSVQEIICQSIEKASKAEGSKFLSSGREDVDVRMLGRGRPFACELLNPRKVKFTLEEILDLENTINAISADVAVRDLQVVSKEELRHLKDGEESKRKRYSALCISHETLSLSSLQKLESITDLILSQKTPIRVLHRRPLAVRSRTVYSMKATPVEKNQEFPEKTLFKLDIIVQAGTYIKEFVHGDFGRTKPNLRELLNGVDVDILALDVEEILLDWPKPRTNIR